MIAYPRRCRLSLLFALAVLTTGQPISVDGFRPRAVAVQQQDGRRFKTAVALNKEEEASPPFPISRSQTACLQLRGGGVAGVIVTLLRTAVKNPVLILLMVASSLLVYYKEQVPYAKALQSVVHACMVVYFFMLLVAWQQMQQDAADES